MAADGRLPLDKLSGAGAARGSTLVWTGTRWVPGAVTGSHQFKESVFTPVVGYQTASTTYTDIDPSNLPALSLDLAVGDVVSLLFVATFSAAVSGNVIGVDWEITQPSLGTTNTRGSNYGAAAIELGASAYDCNTVPVMSSFTAAEAGSHSFLLKWRNSTNLNNAFINGAGYVYETPIRHRVENLGQPTP